MIAGRRPSLPAASVTPAALVGASACVLWVAIGVAVAFGRTGTLGAVCALSAALWLGLRNWRWAVYGLLLYIPVSGVPYILTYPDTRVAVLLKDLLFVMPAYAGFAVWAAGRRVRPIPPGTPLVLIAGLAVLVVAQALNPAVPNHLVGAIGVKVWLLYLPMYVLGYHLVPGRRELWRVLGVMAVSGLVPAVIGIVEALLIYSGRAQTVYGFYGTAAEAATQHFAVIEYGKGYALQRVPSTFSYVAQYYCFVSAMVAVVFAWWRGRLGGGARAYAGFLAWGTVIAAGMLTGQLGAVLFVPFLALLTLALHGHARRISPRVIVAALFVPAGVASLAELVAGRALVAEALTHGLEQVRITFFDALARNLPSSLLGHGTGTDTISGRYAFSDQSRFTASEESWYLKVLLELGLAGLGVVVALLFALVRRALRIHAAVGADPRLKAVSAAIVAFMIWNLIYAAKGPLMDLDPINVYFWLFAGILTRLPYLLRAEPSPLPAEERGYRQVAAGRPPAGSR